MALTFVIGSGIIFAMPYADAAGAIEGEFKLGEVLDESVGWFIVVGLGMVFAGIISAEIKIEENTWATCKVLRDSTLLEESLKLV